MIERRNYFIVLRHIVWRNQWILVLTGKFENTNWATRSSQLKIHCGWLWVTVERRESFSRTVSGPEWVPVSSLIASVNLLNVLFTQKSKQKSEHNVRMLADFTVRFLNFRFGCSYGEFRRPSGTEISVGGQSEFWWTRDQIKTEINWQVNWIF